MSGGHDVEQRPTISMTHGARPSRIDHCMFDYEFMRNAFAAAGIVAVVAGMVGYFLVLRGQTFAGHALSHVGFAGATGAVLIGLSPLWGLVGFTLAAGIGMGLLGERISNRDVAIGIVLSLSLGLGLLFLHFYTAFATQATALLFGNVLAVDRDTIGTLAVLGVVTLAALAVITRPLLFASLQPELAEAKGVSLRFVSTAFLAIVALAVAECAQIVGVLLVFALMVGPPAAAQRLTTGLWSGARARRRAGAGRSLARHHARLLHRLADQLLHRAAERARLFRLPWRAGVARDALLAQSAAFSAAQTCDIRNPAARLHSSNAAACRRPIFASSTSGPLECRQGRTIPDRLDLTKRGGMLLMTAIQNCAFRSARGGRGSWPRSAPRPTSSSTC